MHAHAEHKERARAMYFVVSEAAKERGLIIGPRKKRGTPLEGTH